MSPEIIHHIPVLLAFQAPLDNPNDTSRPALVTSNRHSPPKNTLPFHPLPNPSIPNPRSLL